MTDPPPDEAPEPLASTIAGCADSHARLLERLERVDDVVLARPSRLPGWTVGHVLTHLARNADAFVNLLEAAAVGEPAAMYAGGRQQRAADIEAGSARPAEVCIEDVRRSARRIEEVFAAASGAVWAAAGVGLDGQPLPCREVPFRRWKEVEIHHVDLGLGYEAEDWPADFVLVTLADSLGKVPSRVADARQRAALLAWVTGRRDTPGPIDFTPF